MPDSPLTRYSTQPAGIGWWDQPLSQRAADRAEEGRQDQRLNRLAALRASVLEGVHRANPDWTLEDWDRFYQENADAFDDSAAYDSLGVR